jgi:cell division protein FtsL
MSALTTALPRRRPATTPEGARRPELRVVPPRRRTGRYLAAMVLVGAVGVFGIVSLSALAAEAAFAARALEQEIDELAFRYDELTVEVATLESPARVREVATTQLGMVRAEQPAFLIVERQAAARSDGATALRSGAVTDPVKHAMGAGN